MAKTTKLAGRKVYPSFGRLKFLFDTDEDLRARLRALPSLDAGPVLDQDLLRRWLYFYDKGHQPDGESVEPRYREVALRKYMQGDSDFGAVGWDLLSALPLRDEEKVYVSGLLPHFLMPPDGLRLGICEGPYARVYGLASRFKVAKERDLEAVAEMATEVVEYDTNILREAMCKRLERGTEKVFVLHRQAADGQCAEAPKMIACVRLWFLNADAVLGILSGRIKKGDDIGDQGYETVLKDEDDKENHVGDDRAVAGVYVPLLIGRNPLASTAAVFWLRSYLMSQYPGRPVFTRPTTDKAIRAVERRGGEKTIETQKIYETIYKFAEIPI
ncbi:hypothetical protein [Candidatus Poriferisocius sp.]|uniref:hypothetical protein n=1 Tax=Candidatus Poriferisocius sp. TaxID=3101276 RepID=UPI003B52EC7B